MKHCLKKSLILGGIMIAVSSNTVLANDCFIDEHGNLSVYAVYADAGSDSWQQDMMKWFGRNLPGCSYMQVNTYFYNDPSYKVFIYKNDIDTLTNEQAYINAVSDIIMRTYVQDGETKEQVVEDAVNAVCDTLSYDYESVKDLDKDMEGSTLIKEQGAYYSLTDGKGKGVCATYSKLFRCYINAVPFDETGIVNWESGTYHPIKAVCVENNDARHEWNAVIDDNGNYHFYDLSSYDNDNIENRRDKFLDMSMDDLLECKGYTGITKQYVPFIIYGNDDIPALPEIENPHYIDINAPAVRDNEEIEVVPTA